MIFEVEFLRPFWIASLHDFSFQLRPAGSALAVHLKSDRKAPKMLLLPAENAQAGGRH